MTETMEERHARILLDDERHNAVELAMLLLTDPVRWDQTDTPSFKLWIKRADRAAERLGWTW